MYRIPLLLMALTAVVGLAFPAGAAPREAIIFDAVKAEDKDRVSTEPVMVVYTDGRIVVRDPWKKKDTPAEQTLDRARLGKLLNALVQSLDFMSLKSQAIDTAIAEVKARRQTPDAPETPTATRICVTWAGETNDVSYPALNWHAERYPEIEPLRRLSTASRLLHVLRLETLAGGKDVIDKSLKLINQQLQEEDKKSLRERKTFSTRRVRVTASDLQSVTREPDRVLLEFVHLHEGRQSLRVGATAQVDTATGRITVLITTGKQLNQLKL